MSKIIVFILFVLPYLLQEKQNILSHHSVQILTRTLCVVEYSTAYIRVVETIQIF